MKKLLAVAAVLLLTACGATGFTLMDTNSPPTPIGGGAPVQTVDEAQQAVFAASATYASLLAAATQYAELPRCSVAAAPCAEQSVVDKIKKGDTAAFNALSLSQELVRSDDPLIDSALKVDSVNSAILAINSLRSLLASFGIGGISA